MPISRALGALLFLAGLMLVMPAVVGSLSNTLLAFLESAREAFTAAGMLASHAASIGIVHLN